MASILKVDTIQDQSGNNIINENADTITIGASGDTITIPTGASLTVPSGKLTGQNYPAFFAYLGSAQSASNNTTTKVQIDTEIFDSDSCYDNATNYRFTPTVAGKYFVYGAVANEAQTANKLLSSQAFIYKNGVNYTNPNANIAENNITRFIQDTTAVIDMNGTSDYIELFGEFSVGAGTGEFNQGLKQTYFGAFRLGD